MTADRADFGSRLRAAREARGMSLKDIAATTKISVLVLEALERNDASRLPGGLFSRAFVRAYAKEVGLDAEQTVREFAERFEDGAEPSPRTEPVRARAANLGEPAGTHSVGWLGLGVTVLLVIVWIGVDRYYSRRADAPPTPARATRADAQPPAPVPPPLPTLPAAKAPSPVDAPATAGGASQPDATTAAPSGSQAQGAQPAAPAAAQPPEQTPAPAPPSAAASTPEPTSADASLPLRVVVAATAECWVSARVDDQRVPGRTLRPGEELELSAARTIVLTTGNAGAVTYTVNGLPGRPLGAPGEVKTAVINTSNYRTFATGRQ